VEFTTFTCMKSILTKTRFVFWGFYRKGCFLSKMVSLSMLSQYLCSSKYKPIFMSSYSPSFLWSWNCYNFFFFFSKILKNYQNLIKMITMKINGTISWHNSCYMFKKENCAQKQQIMYSWVNVWTAFCILFLWEFPIGPYVKLSSAVATILVGVLKCRTQFGRGPPKNHFINK
jgi:hypothetical protein